MRALVKLYERRNEVDRLIAAVAYRRPDVLSATAIYRPSSVSVSNRVETDESRAMYADLGQASPSSDTDQSLPPERLFTRALAELSNNIVNLEMWNPQLQDKPDDFWWGKPLGFVRFEELLEGVDLPPALRDRLHAVRRHIEIQQSLLRKGLESATRDQAATDHLTSLFYIIDLYLKQLACYIFAEARRRGLGESAEHRGSTARFEPLPRLYGTTPGEAPPVTAQLMETQLLPPLQPLPAEPHESDYVQCRLEVLIGRARDRLDQVRTLS